MKITNLEECISETNKSLGEWQAEAETDQERATIGLAMAISPEWYRWLKESGASSNDILNAATKNFASMLVEVVANVSKEETREQLAAAVGLKVAKMIMEGTKRIDETKANPDVMAFRKRDA